MALDKFKDLLSYGDRRPNKFTIFLGEQIKKAREEAGLSQQELADIIYKRRATVSDVEKGKGEVDASMLAFFAHVLNKPLGYFYPWYLYKEIKQESLTPLEQELLMQIKLLKDDDLRRLIVQARALVDLAEQ